MTRAVLSALEAEPLSVAQIASKAGVDDDGAAKALHQLCAQHLAIPEGEGYELSGPLSWFGSFEAAVRHHARKRFIVNADGGETHLYVDDVRVKGRLKPGEPANQTVSVMACGRTATDVTPAGANEPQCSECARAL